MSLTPNKPLKLLVSACSHAPMPRAIDTFLAELDLKQADHTSHKRGPAILMVRADLKHAVLHRMLEEAEALAPFLKRDKEVVFRLIRDLVFEETQRSPFALTIKAKGSGYEGKHLSARP